MEKQNSRKITNFWFGFSLGGLTIGLVAFLFGTKKGREVLKKLLELSENLEENAVELEKFLQKFVEENRDEIKTGLKEVPQRLEANLKKDHPTLNSLLEKIKVFSPKADLATKRFIKST